MANNRKQFNKAEMRMFMEVLAQRGLTVTKMEPPLPHAKLAIATGTTEVGLKQALAQQQPAKQQNRVKCSGSAPSCKDSHGMPDAAATITARIAALEALVPGISKVAYIFHVGRNAAKKDERTVSLMVNNPFTYIEFPGGKDCQIGNLTGQAIFDKIKVNGYGFTKQKDTSGNVQLFWATTCSGEAVHRQRFGTKRNVAANMIDEDQ